jgi:hypothetical protein
MMPPISVTAVMLRRWARLKGVSRTISSRRRRSFSVTSAARVSRLSPKAVGDGRQCLHRAGRHHHGRGVEAAAGHAGADVAGRIGLVGQHFQRAAVQAQFVVRVQHTRRRDHQMRLGTQRAGPLQQLHAVDGPAGAGDADDQPLRRGMAVQALLISCCSSPLWYISIMMSEPPTNSPSM